MPPRYAIATPAPRRKAEPPGGNGPNRVYLMVPAEGSAPSVAAAAGPAAAKPARLAGGLTARQHEVLTELGKGASNKQIAYSLGIAEGTVKGQLKVIYRQLGVKNRTQAAMLAVSRNG